MNSKFILYVFAFIGKSPTAMNIAISGGASGCGRNQRAESVASIIAQRQIRR